MTPTRIEQDLLHVEQAPKEKTMYYKQVKLNAEAERIYNQLRTLVAKNVADPDVYIEQLRRILNARLFAVPMNIALREAIDSKPERVEEYEHVDDAIDALGEAVDSGNVIDDFWNEVDRSAAYMEIANVPEDQMPEVGQ